MAEIIIEDWMIEKGLKGFDLLAFALIHMCTQGGDGCWYGGYDRLAQRIGATKRTAIMCVKTLEESGYIRMADITISGKKSNALVSLMETEFTEGEKISGEKISPLKNTPLTSPSSSSPTPLSSLPPISPQEEKKTTVVVEEKSQKRFVKPTIDEIRAYCVERRNGIDAERFFHYYEANGWVVGPKKPMKNWKSAVVTWEKNEKEKHSQPQPTKPEKILSWKDIEK